MEQDWTEVSLETVCNFQNGFAFKNSDYVEDGDGALEVFRMGHIRKGGGFKPEGKKVLVASSQALQLTRFVLNAGDVLMCMTDMKASMALLGHTARMPVTGRFLLNQRVGRLTVKDADTLDPKYLYYYTNSPDYIEWLRAHANSGVQVNLSKEAIVKSPIRMPAVEEQRHISGVLSAYDDLIDNNLRRIEILESMARSLYQEWFVNFRFPGHEDVTLVPSSLGEIPEGWEVKKLGEVVQLKSGFPFKSSVFSLEGLHRLVTIRNVQDGGFNPSCDNKIDELPANLPSHCVLEDGDILLSLTGNVGRVCLVFGGPFLLNQRVSKLVAAERFDWAFIFCMFRDKAMRVQLEQLSNGVAQQNLSPVLAAKLGVVSAPPKMRQRFAVIVEPMLDQLQILQRSVMNLRRTRDLLLTRLLSGELSIPNSSDLL